MVTDKKAGFPMFQSGDRTIIYVGNSNGVEYGRVVAQDGRIWDPAPIETLLARGGWSEISNLKRWM